MLDVIVINFTTDGRILSLLLSCERGHRGTGSGRHQSREGTPGGAWGVVNKTIGESLPCRGCSDGRFVLFQTFVK